MELLLRGLKVRIHVASLIHIDPWSYFITDKLKHVGLLPRAVGVVLPLVTAQALILSRHYSQ